MAIISILSEKDKEEFTNLLEENKMKFYKITKKMLKKEDDVYDVLQESIN